MYQDSSARFAVPYALVTCLFFAWGLITSLVDPLVAAVKGIFHLTDVEAQLSASAFFIAYAVMSLPGAALLRRARPVPTVVAALVMMVAGCMIMLVAANLAVYEIVLLGLFVLASGITLLQVAANPLAAVLGPPEQSHFRLTFSQAFNSLGTFVGPYLGSFLFLKGIEVKDGAKVSAAARSHSLAGIDSAFFWIAFLIVLIAALIIAGRRRISSASARAAAEQSSGGGSIVQAFASPWALFGGLAIFLYVGAEVSIGTQMALFLNSTPVWNIPLETAGKFVSLYWGGAMIGRLAGSALLRVVRAPRLLATFTAIACALCLFVVAAGGEASGYAALGIGLLNSIMFPVIFTITLERSSASEEATSGLLCFSIVGGAAIPPITGFVAQHSSYITAFAVPAACYATLCLFAISAAGTTRRLRQEPSAATIH